MTNLKTLIEHFININPRNDKLKPLTETIGHNNFNACEIITEDVAGIGQQVYIQGIFSEFNTKNQNGRIYPRNIMEPEIIRFYEKYVKTNRALGELDHPDGPTINLDNVSHRIVDLWFEGDKVYGKALIGGPKGDDVKSILKMGGVLGVSSRSLGSLNHRNEVDELQIITWDIVHEPSVASAIMTDLTESIKHNKPFDWVNDNTGFITENIKKEFKIINNNMLLTKEEREDYAGLYIKNFFNKLYNG